LTDFDDIWLADATRPSEPRLPIKFCNFKNPRWLQWPFGKSKNRNISALDDVMVGSIIFL